MGHGIPRNNTPLHECVEITIWLLGVEVGVTYVLMVSGMKMLGKIICQVVLSFIRVQEELSLPDPVPDPIYIHVKRL